MIAVLAVVLPSGWAATEAAHGATEAVGAATHMRSMQAGFSGHESINAADQ